PEPGRTGEGREPAWAPSAVGNRAQTAAASVCRAAAAGGAAGGALGVGAAAMGLAGAGAGAAAASRAARRIFATSSAVHPVVVLLVVVVVVPCLASWLAAVPEAPCTATSGKRVPHPGRAASTSEAVCASSIGTSCAGNE